ncbi:MAG: hypothetical protein LDL30_04215 [Desulfovibrio sp.]|nr:hypothetical protein [Desulfovibrio sp.]MCA1985715.1 hypothetical protein [Desulfovibrio sp.]
MPSTMCITPATRAMFILLGILLGWTPCATFGPTASLAQQPPGNALHQAFTAPCEASPVHERPTQGKDTSKGASLYLTTRCIHTGESRFWDCLEKQEGGSLLMDCKEQHADGRPGQEVRVVFTTRERLGVTLCGVSCKSAP